MFLGGDHTAHVNCYTNDIGVKEELPDESLTSSASDWHPACLVWFVFEGALAPRESSQRRRNDDADALLLKETFGFRVRDTTGVGVFHRPDLNVIYSKDNQDLGIVDVT